MEHGSEQRKTLLRMLADELGKFGPVTRAQAAEQAAYWLCIARPTPDELAAILATFPEQLQDIPADVPPHHGFSIGGRA